MIWPPTSQRGKSCLVIFLAYTRDVPVSNNFLSYADAINNAPAANNANFDFIMIVFVGRVAPARVLLNNCEILYNNVQTTAKIGLFNRVRIHDDFNGFSLDALGLSGLDGQTVIITVVLEPINH